MVYSTFVLIKKSTFPANRGFKSWHVAPHRDRLYTINFLQKQALYKPQTCFTPNLKFSYSEAKAPQQPLKLGIRHQFKDIFFLKKKFIRMYRRLSQTLHMLILKQELKGPSIAMKNAEGTWRLFSLRISGIFSFKIISSESGCKIVIPFELYHYKAATWETFSNRECSLDSSNACFINQLYPISSSLQLPTRSNRDGWETGVLFEITLWQCKTQKWGPLQRALLLRSASRNRERTGRSATKALLGPMLCARGTGFVATLLQTTQFWCPCGTARREDNFPFCLPSRRLLEW